LIVKRSAIVLLSAILSTGSASLAAAEAKIGVVNIARLAQESPQAKEATEKLRAEFGARQTEIETLAKSLQAREAKLTKDAATMTEVQRTAEEKALRDGARDFQLKRSSYSDDLNARQQVENEKMQTLLSKEVEAFAKAQGYDLILIDAAYATPALDVTNALLQVLQTRKATPAAAAAPAAPAAPKPAAPAKQP
jgi:outer membrane protein